MTVHLDRTDTRKRKPAVQEKLGKADVVTEGEDVVTEGERGGFAGKDLPMSPYREELL